MNRRPVVCLLSLCFLVTAWSVGPAGGMSTGHEEGLGQPQTAPDGFGDTSFQITVYRNQSARWTVEYSRRLANSSEIAAFESFATEFNRNETDLFVNFRSRARALVAFGENATGRTMAAAAFERRAYRRELGETRGVVEMSFQWRNFARAEANRVIVDDVFAGGMYVGEGQRLEFHRGPSLGFVEVDPPPDSMATRDNLTASGSVTWFGERQFADRRPYVGLAPREAVAGTGGGDGSTPTAAGSSGTDPASADSMLPMLALGLIALLVLGGGLLWYGGYSTPREGWLNRGWSVLTGTTEGARRADPVDTQVESPDTGVAEGELVSDEDRVEGLLEENGGRMKQVRIVEKTEWSKSKVSMLLSDMEEDGRISKLRVGRENIISLAGEEPEAAGSPFEDE